MSRYQPRNVFRSGQVISASDLNDNFAELEYAINNGDGERPGNGITRENISRRSVPPLALDRPYMLHTWGAGFRTDSFTVGGVKYYGISSTKTFHLATPDQDVKLLRLSGHAGNNLLAGANNALVHLFVDDEDTGRSLLVTELASHSDFVLDVKAGSKIEAKFVNTHNGKFVSGAIWLYAQSLPWI